MTSVVEIAIIGTGFSGINMAINLVKKQVTSFIVFEKLDQIGGVWRDNIYPGCTCDIRAALYSIKSEPNPNWSSNFPKQQELFDYLKRCVEKYNLESYIKFGTEITSLTFDEKKGIWDIISNMGNYQAKTVILATGPQRLSYTPTIPGMTTFQKKTFHSVHWDHSVDLTGLKIAVIGTGASSIQIVPNIQSKASQLYLFQRTPAWILPRMERKTLAIERWVYRTFPMLFRGKRELVFWFYEFIGTSFSGNKFLHNVLTTVAKVKLLVSIKNPSLRKKLTPNYEIGCKRILVSDDFYKALNQPNVTLVTENIERISTNSIHTTAEDYDVDLIVFGTGFTVADLENYIEITGCDGLKLSDCWEKQGAEAYLGINVSGFPNLCYLLGPNSGLSHSSALHAMESQVTYVLQYLDMLRRLPNDSFLDVKPEIQRNYNDTLQKKLKGTVWDSGCSSWFLNKHNKNTVIFPGNLSNFRKVTSKFESKNYEVKNNH